MKGWLRSSWERSRLPECCGALAGAALGLALLYAGSPENFSRELVVVASPDCGKSQKLVASILHDEQLRSLITPVSLSEDPDDPIAVGACGLAFEQVVAAAPWFELAGSDWVCARLRETAARDYAEAHYVSPVWVSARSPIGADERDAILNAQGYDLLPDGTGVVLRDGTPGVVDRGPARPIGSQSEWRGEAIGF